MSAIEIRLIEPGTETESYLACVAAAMGSEVTEGTRHQHALYTDPDRTVAAFEGDEVVATGQTVPFEVSVPGGFDVSAAGVKAVSTLPTHRRRGLLTSIMRHLIDDAVERGEPLSILWPTESAIYPRFGYSPATTAVSYRLASSHVALLPTAPRSGRLRLVHTAKARETVESVYEALRAQVPGMSARTPALWDRFTQGLDGKGKLVVVEDGGRVTGYARYTVERNWSATGPANEVSISELVYLDPGAAGTLWGYLLDLDLVSAMACWHRPPDDPLPWLISEGRRLERTVRDGMWLRLLDVGSALSSRRYRDPVDTVIEIHDAFLPQNAGRWRLEGGPDGAVCQRTSSNPDLSVDVSTLSAVYLGAHSLTGLAAAGRAEQHRAEALERADRAFRWSRAPWAVTWF